MQFTQEELGNLKSLIMSASIKGADSMVVALLLQKIAKLLTPTQSETTGTTEA